jgi:hypothetical protein
MGCGSQIPRHRATKCVNWATKRSALCNSSAGSTPNSSGPACGNGNPPIFPMPLTNGVVVVGVVEADDAPLLRARWERIASWDEPSSTCSRCIRNPCIAHWNRKVRAVVLALLMAATKAPSPFSAPLMFSDLSASAEAHMDRCNLCIVSRLATMIAACCLSRSWRSCRFSCAE